MSGSNGLSACADATLILDRTSQGTTLYGRGRDIEEFEKAIQFDQTTGRWSILGDGQQVRRSEERQAILDAIEEAGCPLRRSEIVAATGMKDSNVGFLLTQMVASGELERVDHHYTPANTANKLTNGP